MAQGFHIPPVPEFQPDAELGASLASKWRTWLAAFEMFLTASGITTATRKRALLLYLAGSRVREIFQHLPDVGNADDYDTAKTKLTTHFEPQKNRRYEVYRFREAKQEQGETLDQYHTRLRALPCMRISRCGNRNRTANCCWWTFLTHSSKGAT